MKPRSDRTHGTPSRYNAGCRCEPCLEAGRAKAREFYARHRDWYAKRYIRDRDADPVGFAEAAYFREVRRNYGLTKEQYFELLRVQGGGCALCGRANSGGRRLHVDHNHQTGLVRGLLCGSCNRGLGYLRENAALLTKAIAYLEKK